VGGGNGREEGGMGVGLGYKLIRRMKLYKVEEDEFKRWFELIKGGGGGGGDKLNLARSLGVNTLKM